MPTVQLELVEPFKSKFVSGEHSIKLNLISLYDGESETPFVIPYGRYLKSIELGKILTEDEYYTALLDTLQTPVQLPVKRESLDIYSVHNSLICDGSNNTYLAIAENVQKVLEFMPKHWKYSQDSINVMYLGIADNKYTSGLICHYKIGL